MRRCTVWDRSDWMDPKATQYRKVKFMGWLLQLDPKDGYNGKCIVVDERGKMLREDMDRVQVHVPPQIPLLHGAPRRGNHGDGLPADET